MPIKYLHLFERDNEFDKAYNGDSYEEPWVSLTVSHAVQSGDCSSIIVTYRGEDENEQEVELEFDRYNESNDVYVFSEPLNTFTTRITSNIFVEAPEILGGQSVSAVTIDIPEQSNLHMWYGLYPGQENHTWVGVILCGETFVAEVVGTTETENVASGDQMEYLIMTDEGIKRASFDIRNPEVGDESRGTDSFPYPLVEYPTVAEVIYPMVDVDTINRVNYNKKCYLNFFKSSYSGATFNLPNNVMLKKPEDILTHAFNFIPGQTINNGESAATDVTDYTIGYYNINSGEFSNVEDSPGYNDGWRGIGATCYSASIQSTTIPEALATSRLTAIKNHVEEISQAIVDYVAENREINVWVNCYIYVPPAY